VLDGSTNTDPRAAFSTVRLAPLSVILRAESPGWDPTTIRSMSGDPRSTILAPSLAASASTLSLAVLSPSADTTPIDAMPAYALVRRPAAATAIATTVPPSSSRWAVVPGSARPGGVR
jgi:hypothetical protein